MLNSKQLLEMFIRQTLLENKDDEKEIIDDFLKSDMYKKIANLIESSRFKVYESKKEDPVIQDESQVEKIHSNLQSYFGQSKWDIASEAASRSDLIFELRRMQTSKSFHERELSIHKFLNGLGIALEATPFLFLLVYLFNSDNIALQQWCASHGITLTSSFVAFMSMFLFGKILRGNRKKEIQINQDAVDLYTKNQKKAEDALKPYLDDKGNFKLKN